jgi:hypothetical protein
MRLYVPIEGEVKDALFTLAHREDRDPRFQIIRFVREGLIREGALSVNTQNDAGGSPEGPRAA